jgi:hypothetical protein
VLEAVVAKRFVEVALVVVELPKIARPRLALVLKRLVVEAVVAKKLVVVALVPVAFTKVKFWRVEEALSKRLAPVIELAVRVPTLPEVLNKLVEDAVVEKKLVVVAEVVVERVMLSKMLAPVKVLLSVRRVEEAAATPEIVPQVTNPEALALRALALPLQLPVAKKRLVVDAVVVKRLVVVALVVVELPSTVRLEARVILPLVSIARAAVVEVANVEGEEVAR